jgi:hypothetical protein
VDPFYSRSPTGDQLTRFTETVAELKIQPLLDTSIKATEAVADSTDSICNPRALGCDEVLVAPWRALLTQEVPRPAERALAATSLV